MKFSISCLILLSSSLAFSKSVSFEKEILPIFEKKCFYCHGPRALEEEGKYEAGLNLSTRKGILEGSAKNIVAIPGKSKLSSLYTRTALPDDHKKRMPKRGRALNVEDQQLIAAWINEGASFGTWAGVGMKPVEEEAPVQTTDTQEVEFTGEVYIRPAGTSSIDSRKALLKALSQGLPAVTDEQIDFIEKETGAYVSRVVEKANLLEVIYAQNKGEVSAAKLKPLEKISSNVISLKLAQTPVGDEVAETLKKLVRLNELNLQNTSVGTNTIRSLTSHKMLQTLNLIGTKVDSSSVPELNKINALQKIYLQDTSLKEEDFAKSNRGKKPTYRLEFGLDL